MVEEVVSLDLGTEQFFVTNIPKDEYKSWKKVWPLNFMGKLALVDKMEEDLCILVLEDYKKQKWGKRKSLIPSASMKVLEDEHDTIVPSSFHQPEMLRLWVKDMMFISFNIRTGVEEKTERLGKEGHKLVEVLYPVQHSVLLLYKNITL
ncbi:hypothetical protein POM88_050470 [Heracleum sosnowskyi]|uniref:F-box associated beta-propeller type 3 domain-containing protein n=1 Tax=Heracleum sosnowskyi TaxID=360622 RepID=A0AAD8M2E6_9APIA|nr:hypothetical protein POM88_050470 [Heracleum sosnowskyi]